MLYEWIFQLTAFVACVAVVVTVVDVVQRACAEADDPGFDHVLVGDAWVRTFHGPSPDAVWVDEVALWGPPELGNEAAMGALVDVSDALDTLAAARRRLDALEATP